IPDLSRSLVHLRWLLKLVDFRAAGEFSWGENRRLPITTAVMGMVSLSTFTSLSGPPIYIPTHNEFQWTLYEDPAIRAVIPDEYFQNPNAWYVKVPLVNFATMEIHQFWSYYIQIWEDQYDYIPTREPIILLELACMPEYMQ
ncbi:hypothetical protein Gotur_020715, partial [Gossypium turneri]